jgi:hypothetical protein
METEAISKQLGADLQDRLSMTTALGSAALPQASRHARRSRSSRQRHRPSRVHQANRVNSVPNRMSQSRPMARHRMPPKHRHQIALRSAAPVNAGFDPDRFGRVPAMAASSVSTSSTKASTSQNASHEA